MKLAIVAAAVLAGALVAGCHKKQDQTEAIRAGILKHLGAVSSLNISAMDMNIKNVNIQGKDATALVEFRPKSGAPAGAGMQVSYSLEKQDQGWVVVKTESVGGEINHPATGGNPHAQPMPGQTQNQPGMPDLLHPGDSGMSGALPPGHPPVSPGNNPNSQSGGTSSNSKQP
jgi:outer membrane murein-binding lipoprotein Lpp